MLLQSLELQNFRGFRDATIRFDERLTVLAGTNGSGKTSILDALAILLDQYTARLLASKSSARRLKETDTTIGAAESRIRIVVKDHGSEVRWSLRKQGRQQRVLHPTVPELGKLNDLVRAIADRSLSDDRFLSGETLPVYYDQTRALLVAPKRKRGSAKHLASEAFVESRSKTGLDFRGFVYWFEERESEELRLQRRNPKYEDRQLSYVRRTIANATSLEDLSYRTIPPRGLVVRKQGTELHVDQLSAGERLFLAMAGDLARRLSMLGENVQDKQARAIVLIDEVELHLHPRWQRRILPWMLEAFPACQFVVTTHSPQVIGEIEARHIHVLQYKANGNELRDVDASLGRDSNFLLLSVFNSDERRSATKASLESFEDALARDDLVEARTRLKELEKQVEGSAPELAIAQARYDRRARPKP